jgi:hypothetical protein
MTYGTINADVIGTSVAGSNLGAGNASIMKNRLINGAFTVSQYNGASSVTNPSSNQYTIDRWQINTGFTCSCGQNLGGVTPPPNFSNYLGMSVGSAGQSLTNYSFRQWIEGFNSADLAFGTANAKTVTLSFWVRSSVTGTFGGALQNEAGNRSYPYSYTIAAANTWQQVTVTIPGDTSGTWTGATNGYGIQVIISYGAVAARQGTPGAWAAADYRSCTGQVDLFATNGATFYITGVQLEVGSSATGYEYRQYGQELALCQRYYQYVIIGGTIQNYAGNGQQSRYSTTPSVQCRASPTVTTVNNNVVGNVGSITYYSYTVSGMTGIGIQVVANGGANSYTDATYTASLACEL